MEAIVQREEMRPVRAENDRDKIIERKLRLIENPSSIVIAPKTREGHTMVKILFAFDRAISRIRLRAGTYIKVQDVVSGLKRAEGFIVRLNDLILSLGDGRSGLGTYFEDIETKKMLARKLSTYIILPRSSEGREVAMLIKRLDPAVLQFRSICTDFGRSEEVLRNLVEAIRDFDAMVRELSSLAGFTYDSPRDLRALSKIVSPVDLSPLSQPSEAPVEEAVREEGVTPRRGRKSAEA